MGQLKNFDTLRLWAATAVIFSHSFLIAEGVESNEPLQRLTGEITGIYGVFVFFILSGFLITRSRLQSPTTLQYLWKRFLRIYPAYIASILITVVLICPWFSERPIIDFLSDVSTWKPVVKCLIFINGAVNDSLMINGFSFYATGEEWSMGSVINGVFWTIKIEILLYLAIAALFIVGLLKPWFVGGLCAISALAFYLDWYPGWNLWGLSFGAPGFFMGSLLYFTLNRYDAQARIAMLCVLSIIVATYLGIIDKAFPILAAYPILYLGTSGAPNLGNWRRFGDLSYGIYLFGWLVQQLVRVLVGDGLSGWTFFLVCMPVVTFFGWLSWNVIEKPALRYRKIQFHTK